MTITSKYHSKSITTTLEHPQDFRKDLETKATPTQKTQSGPHTLLQQCLSLKIAKLCEIAHFDDPRKDPKSDNQWPEFTR